MDKNKLKKMCLVIFWLAIIALIIYFVFIRKTKEEVKNEGSVKQEQILETKNKEIVAGLITKYRAIEYKDGIENPTTLSLQNTMINENPIVFNDVSIDDIYMRNGKYYITTSISTFWFDNFLIELECSKELAESINKTLSLVGVNDDNILNQFAIVATIDNISKPQLKATSHSDGGDSTSIEIDSDSDIFLLKGKCIDVINY